MLYRLTEFLLTLENGQAVDWVKTYFDTHPDAPFVIQVMPMGGNTKALTSAIQHVKGLKDKAALLVTVDQEAGKVNHMSVVAQVCVSFHAAFE